MTRAETIARLKGGSFDVLVIGGGIAGAGLALEAARVGARTALVEARDFASGTSSRSSKLVHGGLRYLAQGKFGLTRESVRERNALLRDAPEGAFSTNVLWQRAIEEERLYGISHNGVWFEVGEPGAIAPTEEFLARG